MSKIEFNIITPGNKKIIYKSKVGSSVTKFLNHYLEDLWDYKGKLISTVTQNEVLVIYDQYQGLKYKIIGEILQNELEIYPQDVVDLEIIGEIEDANTGVDVYLRK